jgi:hypothetical protein
MDGYIRPVSGQRLSKHVPVATVTHAAERRGVVYAVRAEELKRNELGQPVQLTSAREAEKKWRYSSADSELTESFCTGGCEDITWAREAEEFPLLEAVARERLMKTQHVA